MVSCSACGISHKSAKNGIRFHRFPKNADQRNAWLTFIGKSEQDLAKVCYLCSQHFDEKQFDRTSNYKVQLRTNAVPTKAVFRSKYSKGSDQLVILPATSDGQVSTVIIKNEIDIEENILDDIKEEIDEEGIAVIKEEYISTDSMDSADSSALQNYFGITTTKKTNLPLVIELKRQVQELATKDKLKSKQIRQLQKTNWTQKRRIVQLISMIKAMQEKYSLAEDHVAAILIKFGHRDDLIDKLLDKDGQ